MFEERKEFTFGVDSIVIRHYVAGIIGGKGLDTTGYNEKYIRAGHVIIRDTVTGAFKPMPVSNGAYGSLPANHEYVGVSVTTVPTTEPIIGIMYDGEVNDVASPYSVTSIKAALKTAIPTLKFDHD